MSGVYCVFVPASGMTRLEPAAADFLCCRRPYPGDCLQFDVSPGPAAISWAIVSAAMRPKTAPLPNEVPVM